MQGQKAIKKICVIGSFNIDIIAGAKRFPKVGETLHCESFDLFIGGGKGANQAVAAGRLGADVQMVGLLGKRFFGDDYIAVLDKNGVKHDAVRVLDGVSTGRAFVAVNAEGDNFIMLHQGANALVSPEYIDEIFNVISLCDIFLFQFEIPVSTTLYAMKKLKALGKTVILDPAPAFAPPAEMLSLVDYITPNEVELGQLTGMTVRNEADFAIAGNKLLSMGAGTVIAKAGKNGSYIVDKNAVTHIPPFKVTAVDPTAAGDTFNAAFALGLAEGMDLFAAVRQANAAAGLSTQAIGAQSAMPTRDELFLFLAAQA